jgi:hypothetical protein
MKDTRVLTMRCLLLVRAENIVIFLPVAHCCLRAEFESSRLCFRLRQVDEGMKSAVQLGGLFVVESVFPRLRDVYKNSP